MYSRRSWPSCGLLVASLFAFTQPAVAQSDVQGVGTWKLNLSKSKLGPGAPPLSLISRIEATESGTKVTGVRIDAEGKRTVASYTAKVDGKDYPIRGSANAETVSLRRIDARTIERIDKRAGKIVESSTTVFSEDGLSSITTGKGHCSRGEEFNYTVVNERQTKDATRPSS
jgi:hypothetical protein